MDFLLTARRDVVAARGFFERAIDRHDVPEKITIDKNSRILRPAMATMVPSAYVDSNASLRSFIAAETAVHSWCDDNLIAA